MLKHHQETLKQHKAPPQKKEKGYKHDKTSEVLQGPFESSNQFCERVCEAFYIYTLFGPVTAKNQQTVNAVFVSQAQGDI